MKYAIGAAACAAIHLGCAAHEVPDPAVAAFAAELQTCVRRAATIEESGACRRAVEARYAPMWRDAGERP